MNLASILKTLTISIVLCELMSCQSATEKKEEPHNTLQHAAMISKELYDFYIPPDTANDSSDVQPIYLGLSIPKMIKDSIDQRRLYDVPTIIASSSPYCKRTVNSSHAAALANCVKYRESVDLKEERLVIRLERVVLEEMLKNTASGSRVDALMAIFAIDAQQRNKHTLILVPCDSNGNAMIMAGQNAILGVQRWPAHTNKSIEELTTTANVDDNVKSYFRTLGIQ